MRRALCQSPAQDIPETGGDCCCEDADDPPGDTLVGEHHRPLFGPFVWDVGMRAAVSQVGGVRIYLGQWLTSTMPWVPRSARAGRRASQDMGPRRRTKPVYLLLRGGRASSTPFTPEALTSSGPAMVGARAWRSPRPGGGFVELTFPADGRYPFVSQGDGRRSGRWSYWFAYPLKTTASGLSACSFSMSTGSPCGPRYSSVCTSR